MNSFYEDIYKIVARIPYGKVMSYGRIARILGRPRAAREVGRAMRYCPEALPVCGYCQTQFAITNFMPGTILGPPL